VQRIWAAAATYTVLGLIAGVYYREFTKAHDVTGDTQLSVVHTHLLALGMLFFLVVLALEKAFTLTASRWFPLFFVSYQVGLIWTVGLLVLHGTLTVLGHETGAALAGVAGLGHIALTLGLACFFLALKERVDAASSVSVDAPDSPGVAG
jgi:hypothetical protein